MPESDYSRKFLRITPDYPLYAEISIVKVGTNTVHTGTARVRVVNISTGGLKFISSLKLPVNPKIIIEIHFKIMGYVFRLNGYLKYKNCVEICENEYGLCFTDADERLKTCLIQYFKNISDRMKRQIFIIRS